MTISMHDVNRHDAYGYFPTASNRTMDLRTNFPSITIQGMSTKSHTSNRHARYLFSSAASAHYLSFRPSLKVLLGCDSGVRHARLHVVIEFPRCQI